MALSRAIQPLIHPSSHGPAVHAFRIDLALTDGYLVIDYTLALGAPLKLPTDPATGRHDGLWRHTCFELFAAGGDGPAYREFNFSPSGAWQAYAFTDYRQGGPLEPALAPDITAETSPGRLVTRVRLPLANLPGGGRWKLGLTAVLEAEDGDLSYWALRHPPGKPDFHHPDTFALDFELELPRP